MNLPYVHKLLVAADQQRHGFLRIGDRQTDRQVRLMAGAGLVDATLSNGKDESFTATRTASGWESTFGQL